MKAVSASALCQKQALLPQSTHEGSFLRRDAHSGAPEDTQAGSLIWAAKALHWLVITELLALS